jgi:hypothetical protein
MCITLIFISLTLDTLVASPASSDSGIQSAEEYRKWQSGSLVEVSLWPPLGVAGMFALTVAERLKTFHGVFRSLRSASSLPHSPFDFEL